MSRKVLSHPWNLFSLVWKSTIRQNDQETLASRYQKSNESTRNEKLCSEVWTFFVVDATSPRCSVISCHKTPSTSKPFARHLVGLSDTLALGVLLGGLDDGES